VQTPHYSDREGFFMNSYKSAGVMKSGFPYENKDDKIRQDFLRTLRTTIQKISRQCDFDDLYLFVPSYLHQEAVKALPAAVKDRLKGVITGTYYREHPFVLLDKLQVQTA
jgi:hypothetical protein